RSATVCIFFFFSSRRRHTRFSRDWSSDVCSSDLCRRASRRRVQQPAGCRSTLAARAHAMKRPFDLQQLQCFVALAETRHFGQAARRLHMTQSPLSRQIALLEQRLGVQLLVRSNRSVSLTPAGVFLLHEARAILHRASEAASKTQLAARGEQGTLVIG